MNIQEKTQKESVSLLNIELSTVLLHDCLQLLMQAAVSGAQSLARIHQHPRLCLRHVCRQLLQDEICSRQYSLPCAGHAGCVLGPVQICAVIPSLVQSCTEGADTDSLGLLRIGVSTSVLLRRATRPVNTCYKVIG